MWVSQGAQAPHTQLGGKVGGWKLIGVALAGLTCARGFGRASSFHLLSHAMVRGTTVSISQRRRLSLRCSVPCYFQLLSGRPGIPIHQPTLSP